MSQLQENKPVYRVTYLTGNLVFKEPEWFLTLLPRNRCLIESEFCTITGERKTLINAALAVGIRFKMKNE